MEKLQQLIDFADVPFVIDVGNLDNVKQMLPMLYPTQQEDVARAEDRLQYQKAYMFTNGTGTGKTFVGLGIIARFYAQGKRSILVVVPTAKKANDWVQDGFRLSLNLRQLDDTNDAHGDIIVTTYANFYQNGALFARHFDLVVYDECHYLNQNAKGEKTTYFETHEIVAKLPRHSNKLAMEQLPPYPSFEDSNYRQNKEIWEMDFDRIAKDIWQSTKVIYLSATPFAYHKSLLYADGTLWHFEQHPGNYKPKESYGYNEPRGFEAFLCERFGYRMRNNKCTIPEAGVDISLLERKFFEDSVKDGLMSTRQLFLNHDYSRHFIRLESELGERVDKGIELIKSYEFEKEFRYLSRYVSKHFNYLFQNQILEMIKAKAVIPRIKQHLAMNRKVIIYHSYNFGFISHPFRFDHEKLIKPGSEDEWNRDRLIDDINAFYRKYPELHELELEGLKNVRDTIKDHFPKRSVEFNGKVTKAKRMKNADIFMEDYSEYDIMVVQVKAGKEGISFHDKTGEQQRVLITLGLPIAPTDAIQIEGRIYREGVKSNAVYEYITLQTSFEATAFADKIATRSKTAENLAMGNLARDLETAFKEGYLNWTEEEPGDHQGVGGVEDDKDLQVDNEFDRACTFYYMQRKKDAKTKAKEGKDYFATPEPLGYKMVQWLGLKDGDAFLEPSAGHGAIARWASPLWENKFVEPSYYLAGKLSVNTTGEVLNTTFENFYIGNKFNGIAMNPPFGVQSKTAAEHVWKAIMHLRFWGILIAIVPAGESFNKRLKNLRDESRIARQVFITHMVKLPDCTFKRAGTTVRTNILRIVRVPENVIDDDFKINTVKHDFTWCENVEMLFGAIEDLKLDFKDNKK